MKIRILKQFGSNAPGAILESSFIGEGVADALLRVGKAERVEEADSIALNTKSVTAKATQGVKAHPRARTAR